ncbi:hypothetical protein DYBT9275_02829 [Dyadobacter sp. CECT 9275]|uniref:Uncharacterized protein n=1 Tax=Dyadobacter helix TaxID=2822344 RepID=A0A916JDS2_9BACT|nr:hypothetical protein [Dyadobacter sp. CECT 9275]CAG5002180.1 hypothetical protein DYBT9275_02829 [Dyadobacter sp. CECT 9275]
MIKNVLIGIGGTGSRVIESVVHLCAAGLGPDKLHIFMIDPDQGNGNLTRTKSLIKRYTEVREKFQRTENNKSFKTEIIIPPGDAPFIWSIFDERDYTLSKYINYDNISQTRPEIADLANVLFTEKELTTSLNEGFRGHPSIGAVVMADPPMDEYPFKLLWDGIESLGKNDLRVFIVGSIFGGTGAAGFPTLGSRQLIKFNEKMHASLGSENSRVLLGGALVLPYFSFSVDTAKSADEPMFVTTSDFPIATKAALQYYDDKELGFDQYYFIGDSLAQKVGEFSTGSSTQENKPHYVEMVSALSSFDFFAQSGDNVSDGKKYFLASRENAEVTWNMLPLTRASKDLTDQRRNFKKAISNFTIFSYAYLTYGKKELGRNHRDVTIQPWYSENFKKDYKEESVIYNPRHTMNSDLYAAMDDYLNSFLFWISAIDDRDKVLLVDSGKMIKGAISNRKLDLIDPEENRGVVGQIIKGESKKLDFNAFRGNDGLLDAIIKNETITAGSKYLNIFYDAANRFNLRNLVNN